MSLSKPNTYINVNDYLAGERDGAVRHEYVQGQVYAMAGASDRHNRIALNLASRFNDQLTDDRGETFIADMKVKVAEELYYYPDVVVACDPPGGDPYFRTQPHLIVEVLSPSTEGYDRGEKFDSYREIESLQEYVLVSQTSPHIQTFLRQKEGMWLFGAFAGIVEIVPESP